MNQYHDNDNKANKGYPQEKDHLDPQCVFKIKHSEIPKGVTQCENHKWVKLNDAELKCVNCPTVIIINSETINEYL